MKNKTLLRFSSKQLLDEITLRDVHNDKTRKKRKKNLELSGL